MASTLGPEKLSVEESQAAGDAAMARRDYAAAIAAYRQAVSLDRHNVKAHRQLLFATRLSHVTFKADGTPDADEAARRRIEDAVDAFRAEYETAAEAEPASAVWPYLLAGLEHGPAKEELLAEALRKEPDFAPAHSDLALILQMRGDNEGQLAELRRAAELAPEDAGAALQAAFAIPDRAARSRALVEVADRFPGSERDAQALYWAAHDTDDPDAARALLERGAALKSQWSPSCEWALYELLTRHDGEAAAALVAALAERSPDEWNDVSGIEEGLATARAAIADARPLDALAALDAIPEGRTLRMLGTDRLERLRIEALRAAGDVEAAYRKALALVATAPSDDGWALALSFRPEPEQVRADVRAARADGAAEAKELDLPGFDGGTVRLTDRRGKVVLLNFWYPGCGPCRNEFGHLMPLVNALPAGEFEMIGVNVQPDEEEYVLPFLSGNGYRLTPARGSWEWAQENYGVRGAPSNFVIDREGRIIARPRVHSAATAAAAERLIRELIEQL